MIFELLVIDWEVIVFSKNVKVVFQNGDNALQILTQLIDVIPEARLKLIIYYLRQSTSTEILMYLESFDSDDLERAFDLLRAVEPTHSIEYILKGVVHAAYGQEHHSVYSSFHSSENHDPRLSIVA